jgi:ribose transport system substrate-binding protein
MKRIVSLLGLLIIASLLLSACAVPATAPAAAPAAPQAAEPTVASTEAAAPASADADAPAPAPKGKNGDKPVVGLVMKSLANEFFKTMEEGATKYANDRGDFQLIPVGMNSETDIDTQISEVENFVTQNVDLICLAPADSVGLVPSVKKAMDAGITVVNFDVKLDEKALKDAGIADPLFLGPDNEEGAYMSGTALAEKLGKGAKVVIIEGNPGADNAKMRKAGFERAAKDGGLEVLESTTAHWETEEANTLMTNLLTKYPDLQGVMAANDSMALGVVKALDAAGKSGTILVVGFDNIAAAQDLIKQGKMLATIDQFGPDMAKFCIETGFKMLNGEQITGWKKTPLQLITAAELK